MVTTRGSPGWLESDGVVTLPEHRRRTSPAFHGRPNRYRSTSHKIAAAAGKHAANTVTPVQPYRSSSQPVTAEDNAPPTNTVPMNTVFTLARASARNE